MNIHLRLPIIVHNDRTADFDRLGIDYDLDDCTVKEFVFFHISALQQAPENGEYTYIFSSGETFIAKMSIEEVEAKILKQIK